VLGGRFEELQKSLRHRSITTSERQYGHFMALDTASKFIYVMKDLTKVVPPNRVILKGIWISFYPGAKIGVVGANGSGKSSLLRIMAGLDRDFNGEAWPMEGIRIGYLPQEPQLDPALDVRGNVEEAVKHQREVHAPLRRGQHELRRHPPTRR
jgi:ATPase subunit of ABC transporter with duplicated ATPase domains